MRLSLLITSLFAGASLCFSTQVFAVPNSMTLQTKIYRPDGTALDNPAVNFRFTTVDPSGTCILYVEDFTSVSMTGSGGLVIFSLGNGARSFPVPATNYSSIYNNNVATPFPCQNVVTTYTPAVTGTDSRKIVLQFNDGSGTGWQTLPSVDIASVPFSNYAGDAQKFNGFNVTDFLRFSVLPTCAPNTVLTYDGTTLSCVATTTPTGNYSTSGNISTTGTGTITSAGVLTANSGAASISSTTGAAIVSGGLGVSGAVNAGGNINSSGSVSAVTSILAPLIAGGTLVGGNITIDSTTNGAKGNVLLAPTGGNVGIGTTTPAGTLDVRGGTSTSGAGSAINIVAQNAMTSGGAGLTGGNISLNAGNGYSAASGGGINLSGGRGNITSGSPGYGATLSLGGSDYGGGGGIATLSGGISANGYGSGGSIVLSPGLTSNGGDIKIDGGAKYSGTDGNVLLASNRGNVGIGTTSPTAPLSVSRAAPGTIMASGTNITGTGTTFTSTFRAGDFIQCGNGEISTVGSVTSDTALTLTTAFISCSGSGYMRVGATLNGGNVGIGTTTPSDSLYIANEFSGTVKPAGITMQLATSNPTYYPSQLVGRSTLGSIASPSTSSAGDLFLSMVGQGYASGSFRSAAAINMGADASHAFLSYPGFISFLTTPSGSTTSTERMRILSTGNVGIGTATPTSLLHIVQSNAAGTVPGALTVLGGSSTSAGGGGAISLTGGTGNGIFGGQSGGQILLTSGSGGGGCCGNGTGASFLLSGGLGDGSAGAVSLTAGNGSNGGNGGNVSIKGGTGTATGNILLNSSGGNVGIGTTSPKAVLEVAGHIANSGAAATVVSCGTTPTITGNDTRGSVTNGTGVVTSCVVTFNSAYVTTPFCTISWNGVGAPTTGLSSVSTTTTLTVYFSASSPSAVFNYNCMQ